VSHFLVKLKQLVYRPRPVVVADETSSAGAVIAKLVSERKKSEKSRGKREEKGTRSRREAPRESETRRERERERERERDREAVRQGERERPTFFLFRFRIRFTVFGLLTASHVRTLWSP
jgi:hypothetical protein